MNSNRRRYALFVVCGIVALVLCASIAQAQLYLPNTQPFPLFDFDDPQSTIKIMLHFQDRDNASVQSVVVVPERTRVRAGDPPLLAVQVLDLTGNVIEFFHAWHPQWAFEETETGGERRVILDDVAGPVTFPFQATAAEVTVIDIANDSVVATADVLPATHDFCRDNPSDPYCFGLANRPPVCDAGGPYQIECAGATTPVHLDGSASTDPDEDLLTYAWSGPFLGSTATGVSPIVTFSGTGNHSVDLSVTDEYQALDMCDAPVSIVDTAGPVITCNSPPSITPPNRPVTYTATANDVCTGTVTPVVTQFSCYRIKPNGELQNRNDCRVSFSGNRVTISTSGGVGNIIEWTVRANDIHGNQSTKTCRVNVVNPGH